MNKTCVLASLGARDPGSAQRHRPHHSPKPREYDRVTMQGRLLRRRGIVTFAVLVSCAEVAGRALTRHVDQRVPRHAARAHRHVLLPVPARRREGGRSVHARRARSPARSALGRPPTPVSGCSRLPAMRTNAAPRLRAGPVASRLGGAFAATSFVYLVHADTEAPSPAGGRCSRRGCTPMRCRSSRCSPCSSRSPGGSPASCTRSKTFADRTLARVRRVLAPSSRAPATPRPRRQRRPAPRRRFGLSFESRPPPLPA